DAGPAAATDASLSTAATIQQAVAAACVTIGQALESIAANAWERSRCRTDPAGLVFQWIRRECNGFSQWQTRLDRWNRQPPVDRLGHRRSLASGRCAAGLHLPERAPEGPCRRRGPRIRLRHRLAM